MSKYEFEVTFDQVEVEAKNPTEAIEAVKKLIQQGLCNILIREK